jgi:hypothetical protein
MFLVEDSDEQPAGRTPSLHEVSVRERRREALTRLYKAEKIKFHKQPIGTQCDLCSRRTWIEHIKGVTEEGVPWEKDVTHDLETCDVDEKNVCRECFVAYYTTISSEKRSAVGNPHSSAPLSEARYHGGFPDNRGHSLPYFFD